MQGISGDAGDGDEELDGLSRSLRDAFRRFEAEISRPDEDIALARAAALLALHADPSMDVERAVLGPLARLGERFRARARPPARAIAGGLCEFLAAEGFAGCEPGSFFRPEKSLMDRVIAQRSGIPISLSLVYMEVGRAGGLELRGANFPGHFLLAFGRGEDAGLLDAFSNRIVSEAEAADRLSSVLGRTVVLDPGWRAAPRLSSIAFLRRMVLNLQNVYGRSGLLAQAARVTLYARALEARVARESGPR